MPQVAVAAAAWVGNAILTVGAAIGAEAAVAGVAGSIATGIAALGFASGAVAAIGAWSTVASVASLFVMTRSPKVGVDAGGGTQVDFAADPNAGVPMVVGTTGTAGRTIHLNTSGQGDKNKWLLFCAVLSIGPMGGVSQMLTNGEVTTFAGEEASSGPFSGFMNLRVQLGAKPSDAFPYPGAPHGSLPEWTEDHKLSGLGAAWWALEGDQKVYASGAPSPIFKVAGPKVYDPRKDDTYPGGDGPQRWDDDSTWSFVGRDNPYLQGITWCIGRWANGKRVMGMGLPVTAIDLAAFVEGANVYEANGWTDHGGVVLSTDRKWDVLTAMLQAGGGQPMRIAGKISCVFNAPKVSLATVTGEDLAGEAQITGTQARRDRVNRGIPRYRSEDHGWEIVAADPVEVGTYITEDGGAWRTHELEFPLVQNKDVAAQLMTYQIADSREFGPIVLPLKPKYRGYRGGDCLTVDEPELGLNGQKVLVLTREMDPASGAVTLTCRSETDAKHPFALGKTGTAPPTPGLTGVDAGYVPAPSIGSWTATGGTLDGADGTKLPAIVFTGGANIAIVQNVIAEWRLSLGGGSYGDWVSTEHPASVTRIEARGLLPAQQYHCRIRYRTVRQIEDVATALDLGLVTTGSGAVGTNVTIGGRTGQQIVDDLDLNIEDLAKEILRGASYRAYMDFNQFVDGNSVGHLIRQVTEGFTDGPESYAGLLNLLAAKNEDGTAALLNGMTVYVNEGVSMASFLNYLESTLGDGTVTITQLVEATAGNSGRALLSINNNGKISGYTLTSDTTGSAFEIVADRFAFVDPADDSNSIIVLGYEDGKWTFNADVYAQNFIAESIKTSHIEADNISAATSSENDGDVAVAGSYVEIGQHAFSLTGAPFDIDVWTNVRNVVGGSIGVRYYASIEDFDTATIVYQTRAWGHYTFDGINGSYNSTTFRKVGVTGLAAGDYRLRVYAIRPGGSSTIVKDGCTITITDQKTQSGT